MPILVNGCKWLLKGGLRSLKGAVWSGGIPIASLLIIVFGLLIVLELEITNSSGIYYLLSAISQSLAAILAIILSATLVAGQLASRYSPRLLGKALIKPFTISYIFIFVASIVFPLVILTNKEMVSSSISVKLSLVLAGACLAFLIPYFLSLKEWLDPRNLIDDLYKKAFKQMQNRKDELPAEAFTIREVVISLYNAKNYEGYSYGIGKLTQMVKDVVPPPEKVEKIIEDEEGEQEEWKTAEIPKAIYDLISILRHMGILVKDDPLATEEVIKGLGSCAITVEAPDINKEIIEPIEEVIFRTAKQGEEAIFGRAAYILGGIGRDAAEKGRSTTARRILEVLGRMVSLSTDNQWDEATTQGIIAIHSVGKKLIEMADGVPELKRVSEEAIRKLGQSFSGTAMKARLGPASEAAWRLRDLGAKALEKGLKDSFGEAVFRMATIAKTMIGISDEKRAIKPIEILVWYGKEAVSKFPEEAKKCIGHLTIIGSNVFESHEKLVQKVIEGIGTIGGEGGFMERKPEVVEEAITSLISLADKVKGAKPHLVSLIAAQLWKFGGYAVVYLPDKQASIKEGLIGIKGQIGEDALERGFKDANLWTPRPPGLSKFKEYYMS
ncbi:MAG: DUF2254 domain-containing protein [Chloroflexi bacterium]|nr:DUF2254 domain-containing protein [Chloroflexota bacterium]